MAAFFFYPASFLNGLIGGIKQRAGAPRGGIGSFIELLIIYYSVA